MRYGTALAGAVVVAAASFVAVARPHQQAVGRGRVTTDLDDWALAGRANGGLILWCVLGGTIFTAYTFLAVPGVVHSSGGVGFYALAYTTIVFPLALLVLPRLTGIARRHGYVSGADLIRGSYRSPGLALAVALTGILATMPYIALQLVGLRAVLAALGLELHGLGSDLALVAIFAVLALSTYRHGLAAPTPVAVLKAVLVILAAATLIVLVSRQHSWSTIAASAQAALEDRALTLWPPPEHGLAYASLAVGSALALFAFPHVLMVALSARSERTVAVTLPAMLGWTLLLGVFAVMGVVAAAVGIEVPSGRSDLAIPLLIERLASPWLAGLLLGVIAVAALVPAAVMSIGVATLFARNVYVEYVNRGASSAHEVKVARLMSLLVKLGALGFALGFQNQSAIHLHLLGAAWVLQTLPPLLLTLAPRRPGRTALLSGWAVGMVSSTAMVTLGGFSPTVDVPGAGPVYAGVAALTLNIVTVWAVETCGRVLWSESRVRP
jgi:solute:Na+ symporter, SSS family